MLKQPCLEFTQFFKQSHTKLLFQLGITQISTNLKKAVNYLSIVLFSREFVQDNAAIILSVSWVMQS
jgi:hypothetical protein